MMQLSLDCLILYMLKFKCLTMEAALDFPSDQN